MRNYLVLIALSITVGIMASGASFAGDKIVSVSEPVMTMIMEPYDSNGQLRVYTTPSGTSYWTSDLPIYTTDTVKVDVFVATGADDLQRLKVKLDNTLISDVSKAPWTSTFDASKLGLGYHFVEAWAQISGATPKTPQFVTKSATFLVMGESSLGGSAIPHVGAGSAVGDPAQTSGTIAPDQQSDTPTPPALPDSLSSSAENMAAKVSLQLLDASTGQALPVSDNYQLTGAVSAQVLTQPGSGVHKFVYRLVSGDRAVVSQDKMYALDTTRVLLQPKTDAKPGLLPGTTYLWVWGVDDSGKYGPPVYAKVTIISQ